MSMSVSSRIQPLVSTKKSEFRVRQVSYELRKCVSSKKSKFRVGRVIFE